MTNVFPVALFGGKKLTVTDNGTTLTIVGQSISISSLSADLQALWADTVAASALPTSGGSGPSTVVQMAGVAVAAGDNVSQAIGAILDASPTWRAAVLAALPAQDAVGAI